MGGKSPGLGSSDTLEKSVSTEFGGTMSKGTETVDVPTGAPVSTKDVTESSTTDLGEDGSSTLVVTMFKLLKAAIAAQTQAAAAQHLSLVKPFTGEGKQVESDGCNSWLEQFEERAKIAGWSAVQQLHQLKLLLDCTTCFSHASGHRPGQLFEGDRGSS